MDVGETSPIYYYAFEEEFLRHIGRNTVNVMNEERERDNACTYTFQSLNARLVVVLSFYYFFSIRFSKVSFPARNFRFLFCPIAQPLIIIARFQKRKNAIH